MKHCWIDATKEPFSFETASGDRVLFDWKDLRKVIEFNWMTHRIPKKRRVIQYAINRKPSRVPEALYLHRHLFGLGSGCKLQVDHINGNGLDNRRANLMIVTPAANQLNQYSLTIPMKTPWGYRLRVRFRGQKRDIGYFRTKSKYLAAKKKAHQEARYESLLDIYLPC